MVVSSYGSGVKSSGVVKIVKDLDVPLAGKDILIVEDILDSGLTLSYIKELLESRGPRSIRIATLLDKPSRRKVDLQADYIGFSVPDEFVIGYGLDYDEKYRNPAVHRHSETRGLFRIADGPGAPRRCERI